jgi:hypothetical protein
MSEKPNRLEQELAGLKPRALSPELRRRVAERLKAPRWTWRQWAATLGTAAAAGLAVLFAWPKPESALNHTSTSPQTQSRARESPTLADYRRAFDQSPVALEQLLSQHASLAARELGSEGELRANRRFDANYLAELGEP